MPTYKIRGIDVDFPFEAYDCQLIYMDKVIQSLQNKCNALLESPTGTGKTLCLLCATLAWRKSLGGFNTSGIQKDDQVAGSQSIEVLSQSAASKLPKIVYTSRTHSQLRQVIKELKRTTYRPKMVILGSREQFCIHEEVSLLRGSAQNNACRFLCKKGSKRCCIHYIRTANYLKNNPHLGDEPIDIEDLVNIGRRSGPCPYFLSRELHKVVDILFAPYNYLIDPGYRRGLGLDWDKSILIFDEAHNLESLCADAASFDLHPGLLTACISEAKNCIDLSTKRQCSDDKSSKPEDFAVLRALLLKLEKRIAEVPINSKELGFTKPGPYIYELLADLNITKETASKLIGIIEEAAELLRDDKLQKGLDTACRLQSIIDILNIIFRDKGTAHAAFYRVHVQEADANAADVLKGKASRTLSWWCFNPGIAMQEFSMMGVGSIILTSGTLSPMESFAQELKLDFPVRLENPHVISSNQIWAGVVPTGPSSYSLNSSYRNRDSLEYKQELGNAIVNIARIVPDGLLIFFPSYYLLDQCIGCWKKMSHGNSTSIWERICKYKKPVVEPRQSALFQMAIEDYMAKLRDTSTSGAVFFAVCRGKVSEGLDFADFAGRAVVITGMPFATLTDPKVRLKREFLDLQAQSQREGYKGLKLPVLTGEDWYNQQASRAVNQAVGRVIRHRHDYGAIIFCDERFAHSNRQSQISLWIQPHIKCYSKYGDMVYMLTRFFRDAVISCPTNHKSIKIEDMGNEREKKSVEPLDKSYPEKSAAVGQACISPSDVKRSNNSSPFEVLPANRLSLSPYKAIQAFKLKGSCDLVQYEKKILHSGRKITQLQNREVIDLSGNSLLDTKPRKEEAIAPCSAKKRKVLNTELDACISNATEIASGAESSQSSYPLSRTCLGKHEKPQISDSRSRQNAEVSALQCKVDATLRRIDSEFLSQKSEAVLSSASGDEETKGSTFLIQVKEELSATEYKEFVGFMKALKSKAMKIGHVLQSIANLFSGPERLPLLRRFKDYVPAKYHSIYEQYLPTNG
ncbi:regulator of telomere elongation helicase 1 homolog [Pistacia vera]|uniref:regulator of telomere elongation helicase 1 homolog n=1 Tax=Pistacia vera TaxID=55513 RepID=UPI001262D38B|nr:regulator of telomere elongation helicase 1 homolog [Pistacia vera]